MNLSELKKVYQLLKKAYQEFDDQVLKEGIDPTSTEYDVLKATVREKLLSKMGFTLAQYQEAKNKDVNSRKSALSDVMNDGTMLVLQKTQTKVADLEKVVSLIKVPTSEEIRAIATEIAKTFVKPPQIINQIVRETTVSKPQIIKETQIEKVVEVKNYNEGPMLSQIEGIKRRLAELPFSSVPTVEQFREEIRAEFDTSLKKNIDILGMPDFRKLAMGLQAQIAAAGGTPGGSNTQVQFNDSGSFGGDNHFIWDKTNDTLTLGTTASPITNLRLWAQGTGDLIDFGSYPSSFGVLGNDVVSGEVGLLSGNDEYIAVRNVSGNFQFGGNASGNTIGIVSRATQSSAGVGILLPVYPWHVVSSDTTRPTILISGKANGGIATVNQLEWWDNTNNVRLGALGDLGDGINGAFWIFGDSSLATYEFADFFAMDRALMSADLRTCGFTVRLNASGTGGYRNDFFIKDGAQALSAKFAVTPDGAIVGSNTDGQNPTARLHILAGSASAGTAPLKLTSGTVLTNPEAGAIEFNTNILSYTTTTGTRRKTIWGAISARATAQTGANASVVTYTLPATDGSFIISANVLVTTATAHNFSVTCAYTDEGNTARTFTFNMSTIGGVLGTAIINTGGAVPYEGIPVHIRCKASTAITIATTGTFTTVTYNVEGAITQIA